MSLLNISLQISHSSGILASQPQAMKKKKQRDHAAVFLGQQILQGLLRRRRSRLLALYLLPLFSAIAACLLFLFAFIPLLCPPTTTFHPAGSSSLIKKAIMGRMNVEKESFSAFRSGGALGRDIWRTNQSQYYYGCSNASDHFATSESNTQPNRYLLIATSGGLNQQRTGITDAVVAAYILNATLIVPTLDQKSYWKDSSNFSDIFDVDQFISFLSKDVRIIKQLPSTDMIPVRTRVPRKCNAKCYETRISPLLNKKHAVQLTKFDYRLSNRLEVDLQKLRCRVNYYALQFTDPILEMGRKLVHRMRMKSKNFIALHLRFEPDMLAFSGCDYGGGEKERKELGAIRKRWKTLHSSNPEKERRQGKCPLSPEEIGLMLRALGFGDDVHIYVASGEIYGGEETLAPLKALFPNFYSKETIATKEELAPFSSFSSRMAALDFIVCDESDVFVSNNNGNMARMLAGRRRYFGHKPTIRSNAKKLSRLLMNRDNMTWEEFASQVRTHQIGFMGEPNEVRPGRGEFHENPSSCICGNSGGDSSPQSKANVGHKNGVVSMNVHTDEHVNEDEQDWSDTDYSEDEINQRARGMPDADRKDSDSGLLKLDQSEVDELISD